MKKAKRTAAAVLAAVLAVSAPLAGAGREALSVTASAEDKLTEGDWKYFVYGDGGVVITKYTGTAAELEIPATLGGKSVKYIDMLAFESCTTITSVTIPNSVTTIDDYVFVGCTSLENITIPEGVESIGYGAFQDCTSLTSITIPKSVDILDYTFNGCTALEEIVVDENNNNYSSEDGVLFNKDKTYIYLYPYAKSGDAYKVPKGVKLIGTSAFNNCKGLKSITIPDETTVMDGDSFDGCTSLEEIVISDKNESFVTVDGVVFNKDKTTIVAYPNAKGASYQIPDGVTTVGESAFRGCESLKSVTIPDGVTKLGNGAFAGCESLESVTIPDGVTTLGNGAFAGCQSLSNVIIPDGVTTLEHAAFADCKALASITLPEGVTTIEGSVFSGCSALESITLPASITSIGYVAFSGCNGLKKVVYGGTMEDWTALLKSSNTEEPTYGNTILNDVEVICSDGIINEKEPETDEPTTSEPTASEPTTSEPTTSEPTISEPTASETTTSEPTTSKPTESTVTPGGTEKPDEQETLEVTLKNVDSENGIEGAKLDELLFGESGWTWEQVEKIEFTSDKLFSVQYKNDNGDWVKLGSEPAVRAAASGEWNTAWTLEASAMGKNKYAKVISKEGKVDVTAKIYLKSGAEKPSTSGGQKPGDDQAPTGIALAVAPAVLAAGVVIAVSKKRK